MSALRTILKNVGSNSLGYVVNVIVGLMIARFIRDSLGNVVYGVWTLVVSFVGYYGLLDVGIRSAVGHYVAAYHSQHDREGVNRTLSTAMAMMLVVAALASILTILAAYKLPDWYVHLNDLRRAAGEKDMDLSEALRDPATLRTVILIMGFGFALSFPMALYGTVIYSVQRIGVQNAIGISQIVLRALLTVWVLKGGHGIVGMASIVVVTNVLGWAATILLAYRCLPELSLAFHQCRRLAVRELMSYGGYNVLVNVGDTVLLYTSGFVIFQALHNEKAVTFYAVPATQLIPYYMSIVQSVTWAFTPYFTGRWATGNVEDVRRLLDKGTRGVLLLATLIAGGLVFLGKGFMAVWQGESFWSDPLFSTSATCLTILTFATLLRASQSCGRQVLFAMREVRYLGLLVLVEAVVNVVLSVIFVRKWGLPGVAFATLLPVIVTQGFVQPRHLLRELEVDWKRFLLNSLRAVVPVFVVMGAINWALGDRLAMTSFTMFIARGVVVALPALLVGFFCATNGDERQIVLQRFLPRPKPT